ncbi:MAG: 2-dehydropantoate 2-reductase [Dehalococcoidia bacterium]
MTTSSSNIEPASKLRVAVMGAGAVGGYLGGLLARDGNSVTLIARGEHLRALQAKGLEVHSQRGDFTAPVTATDRPADVGPVDLVLFTVKTYHNEEAIPQMGPLVGDGTVVLTLQNGVDSWEQLQNGLGAGKVLPGAIYVEVKVTAPGVVQQQGNVYRLVFGETDGSQSSRVLAIAELFRAAGMPTEVSSDVLKVLWTKWLFIAALAGATTAGRASMAELLAVPASRDLVVRVMREIEAVGRKRGINLDGDVVDHALRYMDTEARSLKASMHTDMENGRPMELEALNGAVVRLGRDAGVPTPANEAIYGLLKIHDLKHRGLLKVS